MEEDVTVEHEPAHAHRVGDRLRAAREKAGYDLDQVAAETRIPLRHLHSIEAGDFAALPSRTYAVGFSRTYARTVGLDEREIVERVRDELAEGNKSSGATPARFEPGDPARVPGRGLAWFAVLAAVLLVGGIYAFYRSYFAPGLGPAPLRDHAEQVAATGTDAPRTAPTQAPAPSGPVVFTNEMAGTWVRFYDAKGETLFEGLMEVGDTFTVPADAENPLIRTGRPYAFAITIGGKPVPKLSEEDTIVSDVPVAAKALLARSTPDAAPTAAPAAAPAPATEG